MKLCKGNSLSPIPFLSKNFVAFPFEVKKSLTFSI